MNIITLPGTQPLASAPDLNASDSSAAPASDFGSVLQQAEAAIPETTPAATAPALAPASTPQVSNDVAALPEAVPQPTLADVAQALPSSPPVTTNEPRTPIAELPIADVQAEADDEYVEVVEHLPALPEAADTELDNSDDDSTIAARDKLDAIRERLDLIDNAGVLAVTAPVAWAPAPAPTPEPAIEAETDYDRPATASVEWSTEEDEPLTLEPDLGSERPVTPTPIAAQASQQTSHDAPLDSAPADTPDIPAPTGDAGAALITATSANLTSARAPSAAIEPLGSSAWQADLGQQVIALVRRGDQQMDMQLNPADLGPLSISLNVSESGIQAQFQSAHASVRTAVEQALPQLQAALATQGLTLGEASINDGASRQAMGEQPRRESPARDSMATAEAVAQAATSPTPSVSLESVGHGVDLYL